MDSNQPIPGGSGVSIAKEAASLSLSTVSANITTGALRLLELKAATQNDTDIAAPAALRSADRLGTPSHIKALELSSRLTWPTNDPANPEVTRTDSAPRGYPSRDANANADPTLLGSTRIVSAGDIGGLVAKSIGDARNSTPPVGLDAGEQLPASATAQQTTADSGSNGRLSSILAGLETETKSRTHELSDSTAIVEPIQASSVARISEPGQAPPAGKLVENSLAVVEVRLNGNAQSLAVGGDCLNGNEPSLAGGDGRLKGNVPLLATGDGRISGQSESAVESHGLVSVTLQGLAPVVSSQSVASAKLAGIGAANDGTVLPKLGIHAPPTVMVAAAGSDSTTAGDDRSDRDRKEQQETGARKGDSRPEALAEPSGFVSPQSARTTAASASDAPQVGEVVDREHLAQQLAKHVDAMRLASTGQSEMSLKVNHEHLGGLHLTITSDGSGVSARIVVETAQAQQAVEGAKDQLRSALEGKGLNLTSLDVSLSQNGGGSSAFARQQSSSSERDGRTAWRQAVVNPVPQMPSAVSAVVRLRDSRERLDYHA